MGKIYCVICGKYKKVEKPKISNILEKTLVLSVICSKCKNEDEKIFKEEGSIEILKFLVWLKIYNYFKNMSEEFRLKNIDETRNYLLEDIEQNELMSKKYKTFSTILNNIEHFLISVSTVTGCISVSAFASLLCIPIGIMSSAIGLKIFEITARIKRYNSIIKKKKKKQ